MIRWCSKNIASRRKFTAKKEVGPRMFSLCTVHSFLRLCVLILMACNIEKLYSYCNLHFGLWSLWAVQNTKVLVRCGKGVEYRTTYDKIYFHCFVFALWYWYTYFNSSFCCCFRFRAAASDLTHRHVSYRFCLPFLLHLSHPHSISISANRFNLLF